MFFAVFDHADRVRYIADFFALLPGGLRVYPSGVYEACHLSTEEESLFALRLLWCTDLLDEIEIG